jgi:hypothetical protein
MRERISLNARTLYVVNAAGRLPNQPPRHLATSNTQAPCKCFTSKNVCILKEGGRGGHKCPLNITLFCIEMLRDAVLPSTPWLRSLYEGWTCSVTAQSTAHPQPPFAIYKWLPPSSQHKATSMYVELPIPVAARSKARVCGRSLAGIAGSIPAGGMDVCLLWVLCVAR